MLQADNNPEGSRCDRGERSSSPNAAVVMLSKRRLGSSAVLLRCLGMMLPPGRMLFMLRLGAPARYGGDKDAHTSRSASYYAPQEGWIVEERTLGELQEQAAPRGTCGGINWSPVPARGPPHKREESRTVHEVRETSHIADVPAAQYC